MPGIGTLLSVHFIDLTGGGMTVVATPGLLADVTGLAPVSRDSGRSSGNLHESQRSSRRLLCVFHLSARTAIRCCPQSKRSYDRKRAEGKRHAQVLLAIARGRLNLLRAFIRDGRCLQPRPPQTHAMAA
ncbi:transposase [Actinoallomurus rhizosphaericola]|uniref:transposase n=1 Tax=Actinoallomurus rhizosphaericola TaxID=2952536 RepID=UPI003872CA9F